MSLCSVPQDSRTYAAARKAHSAEEYMVPIEAAWQLEQELADARLLHDAAKDALNNIHVEIGGWIKALMEIRK